MFHLALRVFAIPTLVSRRLLGAAPDVELQWVVERHVEEQEGLFS
jgi:hypothetical protein